MMKVPNTLEVKAVLMTRKPFTWIWDLEITLRERRMIPLGDNLLESEFLP